MNTNKIMEDSLNSLKDISKKCHDMLCKVNEGIAEDYDILSLVFNIREDAAREYNKGVVSLGIHNNFDLIAEMNKNNKAY